MKWLLLCGVFFVSGCSMYGDVVVQLGDGNAENLTNGFVGKDTAGQLRK